MSQKLISSCILTNGYARSLIHNLITGEIFQISKSTSQYLDNNDYLINLKDIKLDDDIYEDLQTIVNLGMTMPKSLDRVSYKSRINSFKKHSLNLVVDLDSRSLNVDWVNQIKEHQINEVQLRIYNLKDQKYLIYILKQLCESDNFVTCIQILLNYSLYKKLEKSGIFKACNKLHSLIIYEVSKDNLSDTLDEDHFQKVMLPYSLKFAKQCGKIETSYFVSNMESFFVSKTCNSCLTGKISIDTSGDIKNCPSMPESYGNIKDTTLEEAINKPDFKKYWNVTKDQIDICKDCEFRYVCTDCRAYTERTTFKEDIDLSKPLKCGYNPYTNEWAEWSTNPLKEKVIDYYGMQELVKKDNA